MKQRAIIQPKNFMDKFVSKFMKEHVKVSTLTYKQLKEKEFRDNLQSLIQKIAMEQQAEVNIPYGNNLDSCFKEFLEMLFKEYPNKDQNEVSKSFREALQFYFKYNAQFVYETNINNKYDGKLYCIIRYNNTKEIFGIYYIGDGLAMKNFIYLIRNKRITYDDRNSTFNFYMAYIIGSIAKHLYEIIVSETRLPCFRMAYHLEDNTTETTIINFFKWMDNKEVLFEA